MFGYAGAVSQSLRAESEAEVLGSRTNDLTDLNERDGETISVNKYFL